MSTFFKTIEEAEEEMKVQESPNPEKRKELAEYYFETNKNIKNFIDQKYSFSYFSLLKNKLYVNDFIFLEPRVENIRLTFFTMKNDFKLEKFMKDKIDLFEKTDEIYIYLEGVYEDQIDIRPIIRNNIREIYKENNKEIMESSKLLINILDILNTAELSEMNLFDFIVEKKLYNHKELMNDLENIVSTLLLTQDIDLTINLEKIKSIINTKTRVSNDIF